MRSEVRAGGQDCVPGESLLQRMLAGFDWEARSRMIEGRSGLEAAVLVAGGATPDGVGTQVSVAATRADLRRDLLQWGFGLSKASGAVAAQVWTRRGHSEGLAQLGAALVRPWWRMDLDISDRLPKAQLVAGYELRDGTRVGPGGWSDVHNRSFADHWRFSPRQEVELVTVRPPHLSLMATVPDGAPAAVTLAHVESYLEDSRPQPLGIVSSVGPVPQHRPTGVATWLASEALCRLG